MERISIFNYEAFYLDYLDGNLNEEDAAMLLDFLKKHPELEVEMDELPLLQPQNVSMDSSFLNSLKQVDFELDAIHLNNCEAFIIAFIEQQLSADKQAELLRFAERNTQVHDLIAQYNIVRLIADPTIVYTNKSELKQSRKIMLWPYVAAAASIAFFIFIYQGVSTNETSIGEKLTAKNKTIDDKLKQKRTDSIPSKKAETEQELENNFDESNTSFIEQNMNVAQNNRKNQLNNSEKDVIFEQNDEPFKLEIANTPEKKLDQNVNQLPKENIKIEQPENTIATVGVTKNSKDNSLVAYNDMKNPIKPITNRLSEFTKTEIDVRTAKATEEKRGGFYLKIGKFEVERPTRK